MKVPERLETKRLILRPYSEKDINEFLDFYKTSDPGFSLVISNKEDDTCLGICGLNLNDGYFLAIDFYRIFMY